MTTLPYNASVLVQDKRSEFRTKHKLAAATTGTLLLFLLSGKWLQYIDTTAGILDIGILSVTLIGVIGGLIAVLLCLWLQELLWRPFLSLRQNFRSHFNQLTSWQQCILYFSVFFLLLYAVLWALAMVL